MIAIAEAGARPVVDDLELSVELTYVDASHLTVEVNLANGPDNMSDPLQPASPLGEDTVWSGEPSIYTCTPSNSDWPETDIKWDFGNGLCF